MSHIEGTSCPTCQGTVVTRRNRYSGHRFLGCSGFPTCKFIATFPDGIPIGKKERAIHHAEVTSVRASTRTKREKSEAGRKAAAVRWGTPTNMICTQCGSPLRSFAKYGKLEAVCTSPPTCTQLQELNEGLVKLGKVLTH